MDCHEARGRFAGLLVGELALTEWAEVEAHVGQCIECGQALDQLFRTAPRDRTRRAADFAQVPARPSRRPSSLTRRATVMAILVLVMGVGIFATQRRHEVRLAGLQSVLPSLSESASSGRANPAQVEPEEPVATPAVAPTVEPGPQDGAPARPVAPARSAAPASRTRLEPARESASPAKASSADVIIQLSVQDRREAERHVKTLLAQLGGTRLGREPGATMILVVPRAKYGELTRGLAQIGSWQMESDAGPLPNPVHVGVRLAR